MGQQIGDLFVKLGFVVDDEKLKSFDETIKGVGENLLKFAGIAGGIGGVAIALNQVADTTTKIRDLNTQLGILPESSERFAAAWHGFNPLSSFSQGLDVAGRLGGYINAMKYGRAGNEASALGVLPQDDTLEKFNEAIRRNLQASIARWGLPQVSEFLKAIYGSAEAINVLNKSTERYNEVSNNGLISQKNYENLVRYNDAMGRLGDVLDQLKARLLGFPAEKLADILEGKSGADKNKYKNFSDYIDKNGWGGFLWDSFIGGLPMLKEGALNSATIIGIGGETILGGKGAGQPLAHAFLQHNGLESRAPGSGGDAQLKGYGWDADHIDAAMRSMMIESGGNPNAYGKGKEARGMPDEAYGAFQWHPDRQAEFAKFMGHDIHGSTLAEQFAFMNYELTKGIENQLQHSGDKFFAAKGSDAAFDSFRKDYERAASTVNVNTNIINNVDGAENPPAYVGDLNNQQVLNRTFALQNLGPPH